MRTKKKYWLHALAFGLLSIGFACNKQPIGPAQPDPAPPGSFMTMTQFRAIYTGSGDVTVPAGTKKIRGIVISNSANEAVGNFRVQDESGSGVYLYTVVGSPVYPIGTVLDIDAGGAGVLTLFNGDLELKNVPAAKVVVQSGVTVNVTPRVATVAQIIANQNTWASTLVKINNVTSITTASTNTTGITYNVTDGTGTISMFVRNSSGINVNTAGHSVTGYVSIFNSTPQIGIRSAADIQ